MTKVAKQGGKFYQIAEGTGVFIEIDKDEYNKLRKEGATISTQKFSSGGEAKKFPDLSGDGDVTMKDILIGRGVIKKKDGGMVSKKSKVAGRLAKRGYGKAMKKK